MKKYFLIILVIVLGFFSCRKDKNQDENIIGPATPYDIYIPNGFSGVSIPEDNPLTVEGVALGRKLFYEELLSGDNSQSCASCHVQEFAFTDTNRFSKGVTGALGTRNSMTIQNVAWQKRFFWDERAPSIEDQVFGPVVNPVEMNNTWPKAVLALQNHPAYPTMFEAAFGTRTIDSVLVSKAIAQFMRTLVSGNSKFDQFKSGEVVLSPEEAYGYQLFNAEGDADGIGEGTGGDCFHCHAEAGGLFQQAVPQNTGLDATFEKDLGVAGVSGFSTDVGRFKIPSLRNVEYSAPYMHDGRFKTLEEVIDHYNSGGHWSPTISPFMKYTGGGLYLNQSQKDALIAFLKTLSDPEFITNEQFSDPG